MVRDEGREDVMADTFKRWMMRSKLTRQPTVGSWNARPVTGHDAAVLGALMYDAYHDTIDDEGERLEEAVAEIEGVFNGKYGPLLDSCSLLVEEDGRALGATIITDWSDERTGQKQPLLAFLMTHPDASGQGLGTFLLSTSINALLAQGESELVLFVTVGNSAAQHIYQKLGFEVEEEFEAYRAVRPE
jgi:ribosomal protein S18 acetylase RimI-like enzyme